MNFCPSITEKILNDAITFEKEYMQIPENDFKIIKPCRKSHLSRIPQ